MADEKELETLSTREVKGPGGRPSDYDPKYCQEIIDFMSEDGKSKIAFAANIGVCKQTLRNWAEKHPEFLAATKKAETVCQAFWEKQGYAGMFAGKDFNATIWIFNMKARFGYKETQAVEHTGADGKPIELKSVSDLTDEQIEAKIQEKLGKAGGNGT